MDKFIQQQDNNDYTNLFHMELFHPQNETNTNLKTETADKSIVPEQLNTDKPLPSHVVLQHLQKVAEHFENYASKLLSAIKTHDKPACEKDDTNNQRCPFMRVASAVGFKYAKGGNE